MSDTKATQESGVSANRFPANATLQHAAKLGVVEDKPIMMDYWKSSVEQTAMLGLREETQEKLLVKSDEEYTSPIAKIYKSEDEYIIMTENSIYIVDNKIPYRKVSAQ